MNEDLHTLSGAYALHALPRREGALFEEHLARCEACEDEVRGLRETAARLALAVAEPPPVTLRPRVLAAIQHVRQAPPLVDQREAGPFEGEGPASETQVIARQDLGFADAEPPTVVFRTRPDATVVPLRSRLALALTAVAAAAAVVLGVLAFDGRQQLERERAVQQEIVAVLAAPDSRTMHQPVTSGGTGTVLFSRERGTLVFTAAGLPPLPDGKVYELWLMGAAGIRPAGLLEGESPVLAQARSGDAHVGLTVEPEGGSEQPTTQPVMFAALPAA